MSKLVVGKIVDSFALDGTVKVFSTTSNLELRYKKGNKLTIEKEGLSSLEVTVEKYRTNGKLDLVKFKELNTPEEAAQYKGAELLVEKSYDDLDEGYYFFEDLVGCELLNEGKSYGKVIKVEEYPAQITLRCLSTNKKEFLVPFVKAFINKVDIKNKKIDFNYMEGML